MQGLGDPHCAKRAQNWDLAYRVKGTGKVTRLSLGRITDVSLEKARERANALTSAARTGRDLLGEEAEVRTAAAARITVEKLIELYIQRRVAGRLAHRQGNRKPPPANAPNHIA